LKKKLKNPNNPPSRPNRYDIPALLRRFPLWWLATSALLFLVIVLSASTQRRLAENLPPGLADNLMLGLTILFLISLGIFLRYWLMVAPRYVRRLEWDGEKILLHPQRGGVKDITWYQIAFVRVPRDTGEPISPYSSRLELHILYQASPYRVPWAWNDTTRAFIAALTEKGKKIEEI
jgi:hypothetical protein